MSEYVNATSASSYTRLCVHGTRTSRTNDYVTLATRIESSRAVICNVTLRKSQERGEEGRGSPSAFSRPPPRLAPMLRQFSTNGISVIDSWFLVCRANMYLLIPRRAAEKEWRGWRGRRWETMTADGEVDGNGKSGRNFTLSRSLGPERKGLPVFQPSQKPSSDRSAFHVHRY